MPTACSSGGGPSGGVDHNGAGDVAVARRLTRGSGLVYLGCVVLSESMVCRLAASFGH